MKFFGRLSKGHRRHRCMLGAQPEILVFATKIARDSADRNARQPAAQEHQRAWPREVLRLEVRLKASNISTYRYIVRPKNTHRYIM